MSRLLLLFPSIHHVMAAEAALRADGIEPDLVPVPKEISPDCGMAITLDPADRARALQLLDNPPPSRMLDDWAP